MIRTKFYKLSALLLGAYLLGFASVPTLHDLNNELHDQHIQEELDFNGPAQLRFSETLDIVLAEYEPHIVDYRWWNGHGEILVTPHMVNTVKEFIASFDDSVEVIEAIVEAVPHNERPGLILPVMKSINSLSISGVAIFGEYQPESHTVIITMSGEAADSDSQQIQQLIQEKQLSNEWRFSVEVVYEESGDLPTAASYGGMAYGGCTGGFIGVNSSTHGIITAAHCQSKPSTYDGTSTGISHSGYSQNIDLRFTFLSGTHTNLFQYNTSLFRRVTSIGTPYAGLTLTRFGLSTGNSSGTVSATGICSFYTSGDYWCQLVRVPLLGLQKGDSGGPVFIGNKAYGINSGFAGTTGYIVPIPFISWLLNSPSVKLVP